MKTATSWKEGFQCFESGLQLLRQGLAKGPNGLSPLETEGIIHRFEYCMELAWKITRDFLEESGLVIAPGTPREVLRQAATAKVVEDSQVWVDMLNHRTLLAHSYDGVVFNEVVTAIAGRYLSAMEQLHRFLALRSKDDFGQSREIEVC